MNKIFPNNTKLVKLLDKLHNLKKIVLFNAIGNTNIPS